MYNCTTVQMYKRVQFQVLFTLDQIAALTDRVTANDPQLWSFLQMTLNDDRLHETLEVCYLYLYICTVVHLSILYVCIADICTRAVLLCPKCIITLTLFVRLVIHFSKSMVCTFVRIHFGHSL